MTWQLTAQRGSGRDPRIEPIPLKTKATLLVTLAAAPAQMPVQALSRRSATSMICAVWDSGESISSAT